MTSKTPDTPARILVICVNYHRYEESAGYLRQLLEQTAADRMSVLVVDNTTPPAADTALDRLAAANENVRILRPGSNLGYFGAASWALKDHLREHALPEWIVVSNTDLEFPNRDFFMRLLLMPFPDPYPRVVAPSILSSPIGIDQNPHMETRPTSFRMHFYKWIFSNYVSLVLYHLLALIKQKSVRLAMKFFSPLTRTQHYIYAPHGSFLIFNRHYFEDGGSLDHGVFLFGEELFVAENVRTAGQRVIYEPSLVVIHREHSTTGLVPKAAIAKYMREAAIYCAEKYFST